MDNCTQIDPVGLLEDEQETSAEENDKTNENGNSISQIPKELAWLLVIFPNVCILLNY